MAKKINWNKIRILLTAIVTITPLFVTTACSLFQSTSKSDRSFLEFYNYEDYMADDDLKPSKNSPAWIINKNYRYNIYGDLPELENYVHKERTVGGIAAEYFIASLASRNLLRKLEFDKVFNFSSDRSKWKSKLKEIYTPETWEILKSYTLEKRDKNGLLLYRVKTNTGYDSTNNWINPQNLSSSKYVDAHNNPTMDRRKATTIDVDGDGTKDELWEYMIPYFIQNKVVVFNPFSFGAKNKKKEMAILRSDDPIAINNFFKDKTYFGILKTLNSLGAKTFAINNYMKDNLMIGSEFQKEKMSGNLQGANQDQRFREGKKYLNNYKKTISDSGFQVSSVNTSGTIITTNLLQINNKPPKAHASFLYNGDALFGYKDGAGVLQSRKKALRIVIPKNPIFFLDGVFMVKLTTNKNSERERFLKTIKTSIFKGAQKDWRNISKDNLFEDNNRVFENFDYVGYTSPFENVHDYVTGTSKFPPNQFQKDDIAQFIHNSVRHATKTQVQVVENLNEPWTNWKAKTIPQKIDINHLAQVLPPNLTSRLNDHNNDEIALITQN